MPRPPGGPPWICWDSSAAGREAKRWHYFLGATLGRAQDLADAARMLGLALEEGRQETRRVQHHAPDALEDLESLITLGKLEMGDARER